MRKEHKRTPDPEQRRAALLDAAIAEARKVGYTNLSRGAIADRVGVSTNLVSHYFGTMAKLERDVIRKAIRDEDVTIIAQGLASRDRRFYRIPDDLKQRAIASIV